MNRFNKRIAASSLAALAAAVLTPAAALAHGPQIQISRNPSTGKIETRQIVDTHHAPTTNTPLTRIYVLPLEPTGSERYVRPDTSETLPGVPNFISGPGLAFQYDDVLAGSGWAFENSTTLPNLKGTNFVFTSSAGLQQWNGSSFAASGGEQLETFRVSSGATVDSAISGSGDTAMEFNPISTQSGNPHSSARHRLLGDGVNSTAQGDDGIYLATFTVGNLTGDNATAEIGTSDPFYFVLHKGVGQGDALTVANSFASSQGIAAGQIQAIPEPASVGLLASGGLLLLARRRRQA